MARALATASGFVVRRHPGAILAGLLAVALAVPTSPPIQLPAMVLLYGLGAHRPLRLAVAGAVATTATAFLHRLLWEGDFSSGEVISTAALCGLAVAFGWGRAQRRTAAERERVLLAERAAAEERLRIARELHDAVGHDVSLIVVQAQALGATAGDEDVRAATEQIASLGRRAMDEMHRTLQLLRDADAARAPQPGLGALDEVLEGARAAGVPVTVAMEGAPRELAPALDASAFRIVQEAVTNVVRHAGGAPASVTVRYLPAALELVVADEGEPVAEAAPGGHGLVGMRERAALFGGTLTAGRRNGRGFEVRALLPYPKEPR